MRYILLIALIMLSGCAEMQIARQKGAEFYDEGLNAAHRFECNDTSVGSIVRRYGSSVESMQRWVDFCFGDKAVPSMVIHEDPAL